jgi:sialate O-acetylesterase
MRTLALLVALLAAPPALAQLRLPHLLSDGAVLQRGEPIPVWGWADPGASVVVRLGGARIEATAGADGRWRVEAPALAAGGPYALDVRSGAERVRAEGLLVGDVWVLSGQSNMEWPVGRTVDAEATVARAADRRIRHFKVPRAHAEARQAELAGGAWEPATPAHVGAFSAVGYEFARALRQHVDVPIGLVNASWGGSRIEPWMSADMLGLDADGVAATFQSVRDRNAAREAALRDAIGGAFPADAPEPAPGQTPPEAAPDHDDAGWATLRVPARWESAGYDGLDGVAWYRTTFDLGAEAASQGVTLSLGIIDDGNHTYVNGTLVGQGRGGSDPRVYRVPAEALRAGTNTLAVRVSDAGGGGGMKGGAGLLFVETAAGDRLPLAGDWRFRVVEARFGGASEVHYVPMLLWNAMVAPLTQAPVTGVLWYQGESNASESEPYAGLFRSLISGWRAEWGRPALPFFWVQLAGYRQPPDGPDDVGSWPALRAAQSAALALPRTAEALAIDVGAADDVHPRDKRPVGERLALAARHIVYGERDLPYSGPQYRSHEVEGGRVVVQFDHLGGGLSTRNGAPLGGFALADADGQWYWADASIQDDRVVVWSRDVATPTAIRYAWADHPVNATLINAEGLPAAPFERRISTP